MEEAEAAIILKSAMRRYSYNSLSESELGIFKGIEDAAILMTMELVGEDLKFTPYTPVDVSTYEKKIASLEATIEEQNAEIKTLKEEEAAAEETTPLTKSTRKRRKP